MTTHKKLSARILSMALSVAMVSTMLPTTVFATEGDVPLGASSINTVGTIQSFDKLGDRFAKSTGTNAPDHVYSLSVALDTPVEDLQFPTELTAMVARTAAAPAVDEPVLDSGKPSEPADDKVVEGDTTTDDTVSGNQPASPSDAEANEEIKDEDVPLAPEPEQDKETTVTTVKRENVPVTWQSDKEYKSDVNGQFIYTAVLSEGYLLADGVNLPQIYVFVGRQARTAGVDVCEIKGTKYTTLKAAFLAVPKGKNTTIKVLAPITETEGIEIKDSSTETYVTLDLNGNDVSVTVDISEPKRFNRAMLITGHLILTDSSTEAGTLTVVSDEASMTGGFTIGLQAYSLTVSKVTVHATGGVAGGVGCKSVGINAEGITINQGAQVSAIGSSANATSGAGASTGIEINGDGYFAIDINSGAKLYAASGTAPTAMATNVQPKDTEGNALIPNEADPGDADPWKRPIATYGNPVSPTTVTIIAKSGATATGSGATLEAAITASNVPANLIDTLKITAGEVTTADWNYLKSLTALTTFEIDSAVTDVANIPNTSGSTSIFPKSIVSATVPQEITIGENAFYRCVALTTASFPEATSIGKHAFIGCTAITSIAFPAAEHINEFVFADCIAITTASFPVATSIGDRAFGGCTALTTLKLGAAPPSVHSQAFIVCPDTRALGYLAADGTALTDTALTNAQAAYKAVDDGDTTDGKWYGWTIVPASTHNITASAGTGGSISPSGAVTVNNGANQTFTIFANGNYSIASVTVDGVSQGAISTYTFSNVTGNHTISASFSYNGGGGGGGGGSSSGGSTTPPVTKPTEPVTGNSNTDATVDNKGNTTVNVSDKNISDAVKAAQDAATKKGVNAGEVTAVINVTSPANSNPNTVSVNLPKNVQEQIISNKIGNVAIVIDKPDISIGMTLATITEMNKQAKSDIQLSATRTDATKLSTEAKNAIGSRPAFDLKATYASGSKSVTNFGTGTVSIAIPYTLQKGEIAGGLYAVYVDGNGKVSYITNSSYDAENKVLRFSTNHFSVYGISYKAPVGFTDIASHWAKTDIEFVANRGLMNGTSNTTFSPNSSMTRGMFVTALGRLAGVDVNGYKTAKFTDVKADTYYAPYVNWAAEKGIVKGTTDTTFAPDQAITRQEMATIMSSYANVHGYKVPETRTAITFADNASIASWAAPAVKQMQMAGILNGKDSNKFDPTGTATRGEISAMLRRYVELVIDRTTTEGWTTNDSGSSLYYQSGKAVTGTKTISNVAYTFNGYGETTRKTATAGATTNPALPADGKKYITHKIVKGDTLWDLAQKHGTTVNAIVSLNNIQNRNAVPVGTEIKIPQK